MAAASDNQLDHIFILPRYESVRRRSSGGRYVTYEEIIT